ncbi:DUF2252 family protein [Allorhizobium taibaishanense]|uniref:DUF2252 domain-containing protein n=2 Tax=Allorhizobium taibaishanense TaxID=887144 RepID=A0A1Q9A4A5_9HYPH|nr:DUF2252 family protein [Allorhizobium taibaishanense]OLP49411.1 hypothetical protein BJF91_20430 [Allorhizobium taibaishanense]
MKTIVHPEDRLRLLLAHKNRKMAVSAHAYVRGSTRRFYEWLNQADHAEIPAGPPVWICGDCHIGNLGPVGSGGGGLAIQIRDLDQAVIGNPAHDLIRLGLSLAMAARSSDLPGVVTALMMEKMVDGYTSAFLLEATDDADDVPVPKTVAGAMHAAARRSWKHLADERIEGEAVLPLGSRFWPLSQDERQEVEEFFSDEKIRRLAASLRESGDPDHIPDHISVKDAAYWRKGCSSLGRLRIAVLLQIGKGKERRYCLMDVKEAARAAAPTDPSADMPSDDGERVCQGALALSPHLGRRMASGRLLGRAVFVRELLPQDLKLEIDTLSQEEAVSVAEFLAYIVGRAHARQLDAAARLRWIAELGRSNGSPLEAPIWLWNAVVELVSIHEAAYLEHCRRFALKLERPDEVVG